MGEELGFNNSVRCAARNCKNNKLDCQDVSFFQFPEDSVRAKIWIDSCNRLDLLDKGAVSLKANYYVCSMHFEDSMFTSSLKNTLTHEAVPTLFNLDNDQKGESSEKGVEHEDSVFKEEIIDLDCQKDVNTGCVETEQEVNREDDEELAMYDGLVHPSAISPKIEIVVENTEIKEEIVNEEQQEYLDEVGTVNMKTGSVEIEEVYVEEEMEMECETDTGGDIDPLGDDVQIKCEDHAGVVGNQSTNNKILSVSKAEDTGKIVKLILVPSHLKAKFQEKSRKIINKEIETSAEEVMDSLHLKKSTKFYECKYKIFRDWCKSNKIKNVTEKVLIAYFNEKSKTFKYSTLWSTFSSLKYTLNLHQNIDISNFNKLKAFIKRHGEGYTAKKSSILNREDINRFMIEASDDKYLMWKVVLIMGIAGACRSYELVNMSVNDVEQKGDVLKVVIPHTKNNGPRTFIVTNHISTINFIVLYKKYISLRPSQIPHQRLFINYKNSRCTVQPVGINVMSKIPSMIAKYLGKPNAETYTGHCFRRTSASLLAREGDLLRLNQHGDWKSSTIAEDVEQSDLMKRNTANLVLQGQNQRLIESNITEHNNTVTIVENESTVILPKIANYGSNCTINITLNK